MKIVVLVKQVPDSGGERSLREDDHTVERASANNVINEMDEYAIEEALKLREAHGGEVTILTMGPPQASEAIRKALSMGPDGAVHVVDDALRGSCALTTSRVLAAALATLSPDLVLAGRYAATETVRMLERLGVRVVVFDYAADFDGIAAQAREIGALIGEPEAAERFATSVRSRLERVRAARPARPLRLLEYGQNGWTHGRGTVLDLLLREAGHVNLATEHGVEWMAQLPLEQVVRMRPEGFIIPRRDDGAPALAHGVFDHAAFRAVAARGLVVTMPPGTTDFGGPATIDNIRVHCQPHNLEGARRIFGDACMDRYTRRGLDGAAPP